MLNVAAWCKRCKRLQCRIILFYSKQDVRPFRAQPRHQAAPLRDSIRHAPLAFVVIRSYRVIPGHRTTILGPASVFLSTHR